MGNCPCHDIPVPEPPNEKKQLLNDSTSVARCHENTSDSGREIPDMNIKEILEKMKTLESIANHEASEATAIYCRQVGVNARNVASTKLQDAETGEYMSMRLPVAVPIAVEEYHEDYEEACVRVLSAMEKFESDATVQFQSCFAIHSLTIKAASDSQQNFIKDKLYDMNAFLLITKALIKFQNEPDVLKEGCWALRNLTAMTSDANKAKVFNSEGFSDLIISIIFKNMENAEVLMQALWLIINLTGGPQAESRKKELDEKGVCGAVAAVMDQHIDLPQVFTQACWVAINLTAGSEERRAKLSELDVCKKILDSCSMHRQEHDLVTRAFWVIRNLAAGPGATKRKKALTDLSVCEIVVEAMNDHIEKVELLTQACWVIINLTGGSSDIKEMFFKLDAAGTIVKAVKMHEAKQDLIKLIFWVIRNMTAGSEERKMAFFELDISTWSVSAMKRHHRRRDLLTQAFWALGNVGAGSKPEPRRESFVKSGLIRVSVDIMEEHSKTPANPKEQASIDSLMESACFFVEQLCYGQGGAARKPLLLDSGFIKVAERALKNCKNEKAAKRIRDSSDKVQNRHFQRVAGAVRVGANMSHGTKNVQQ